MKLTDAKSEPQLDLFAAKLATPKRDERQPAKRHVMCQAIGCTRPLDPLRSTRMFCSDTCRQRAHRLRVRPPPPVLAVHTGTNAPIAAAAKLYIRDSDRVADVTWGKGAFWSWSDKNTRRFVLFGSDVRPRAPVPAMDFTRLAYADACMDHVVLDPPYMHAPTSRYEHLYAGLATTPNIGHAGLIALYRQGMTEAHRVLRPGGLLWVKCQDEIESGKQRRSSIEIYTIATAELAMTDEDQFHLTRGEQLIRRWPTQKHARKNISHLWIFRKAAT